MFKLHEGSSPLLASQKTKDPKSKRKTGVNFPKTSSDLRGQSYLLRFGVLGIFWGPNTEPQQL